MVTLSKIYTKTGDKGDTALGTGERVAKTNPRVVAYGTADELNATLGLARLYAEGEMLAAIERIQNDLFDLGADLCIPPSEDETEGQMIRMEASQVTRLEHEIDAMNANLSVLKSFILPGGTALAAHLHLARTVARRAERETVAAIHAGETIGASALHYLNRLSDWLFVAARAANAADGGDILWVPGGSRE